MSPLWPLHGDEKISERKWAVGWTSRKATHSALAALPGALVVHYGDVPVSERSPKKSAAAERSSPEDRGPRCIDPCRDRSAAASDLPPDIAQ